MMCLPQDMGTAHFPLKRSAQHLVANLIMTYYILLGAVEGALDVIKATIGPKK